MAIRESSRDESYSSSATLRLDPVSRSTGWLSDLSVRDASGSKGRSAEVVPVLGNPDPKRIRTFHVDRQNLTMSIQMRRSTSLTNGFTKMGEPLGRAVLVVCLLPDSSLSRVTPTMKAGIADRLRSIADLLA